MTNSVDIDAEKNVSNKDENKQKDEALLTSYGEWEKVDNLFFGGCSHVKYVWIH